MFDYDTWLTTIPEYDQVENDDDNLLDSYDSWVDSRLVEGEPW